MNGTDSGSQFAEAKNLLHNEVKVYKTSYLWTVCNFEFFEERGESIKSPAFSSAINDEVKWYMVLKPNGETDSKDTISLFLYLKEMSGCEAVYAKYSVSIIGKNPKDKFKFETQTKKYTVGRGWGFINYRKKGGHFKEKLLSNDVLKIFGEVIFSQKDDLADKNHSYHNTPILQSTTDCSVTENLYALLNTHLLSDVVLSVNNIDYPAHKTILAARSKVFAAMFLHDTKENQLNRVDIEDISEEVLGEMLRFIYTGKCEKLDEMAESLLIAADKYDLESLKMVCSEVLYNKLTVGNAAKSLILADSGKADKLKSEVIKFIVTEPIGVFSTEEWKLVLNNSQLMDEMCRFLVDPKVIDQARQNERNSMMSSNILKSWFLRLTNRNSNFKL